MACGATCGITKERAKELSSARAVAALAPSRGSEGRAVSYDSLVMLGAKLESLLPVRVHVHVGGGDECDALYVLAGLHRPTLAALEEPSVATGDGVRAGVETYMRVAVSPHGRFAALQEVRVTVEDTGAGWLVEVEPLAGVLDRRLQHIVKGLQGALRRAKLVVLDLAQLLSPLDADPAVAGVAEPPCLWTALFEDVHPLAPRASLVAREALPVVAADSRVRS